jgi:hypothetical protein
VPHLPSTDAAACGVPVVSLSLRKAFAERNENVGGAGALPALPQSFAAFSGRDA